MRITKHWRPILARGIFQAVATCATLFPPCPPAKATPADDQALADADAYIAAKRRGDVTIKINGASPGQQVAVSLKRLAFNWGGAAEGGLLKLDPTAAQARYQVKFKENFNQVTTKGSAFWSNNDPTKGGHQMTHATWTREWADANGLRTYLHTALFDYADPSWVASLKSQARTSASAKASLRTAINNRLALYATQAGQFDAIEGYNEGYTSGDDFNDSYWKLYGASGVADFYRRLKVAAQSAGNPAPIVANDGSEIMYESAKSQGFLDYLRSIQNSATAQGFGQVIDAIGLQWYQEPGLASVPAKFKEATDRLSALGLPMSVTEYGAFAGISPAQAATILDQNLRLVFGSPYMTGFTVWDWVDTGEDDQWAPYSALFTASSPNYGDFAITPAGKVWQDRLGIKDWDGNPSNGWTTQLTATVDAAGWISFNGFYGDYLLTSGGRDYPLALAPGTAQYAIGSPPMLAGDFNSDGRVDAADYTVWRNTGGTPSQYATWKAHFGESLPGGGGSAGVPEPGCLALLAIVVAVFARRRK